jgi:hypothetical protein
MGNSCGCGHCTCGDEPEEKAPEDKIEDLKKDIADLGFNVEETEDGEIKVSE